MRKVTIDDVSRETGLSRGTVSRALNRRSDISLETQQRVLAACKKLKYVPSHAARSLATGRNFALALFVKDLRPPLTAAMIRGVLGIAAPHGYFVHLVELNPRVPAADRIRQLSAERIDAALVFGSLDPGAVAALRDSLAGRPLACSSPMPGLIADVFEPDAVEAGRSAARILAERGVGSAAYLHRGAPGASEHIRGFREVWIASGRPESHMRVCELKNAASGLSAEGLDALVLDEIELLAATLLAAPPLASADIVWVGLGESGVAPAFAGCTQIEFGGEEIGRRAAHAVLQRIEQGRADPPVHVRVAPRVADREHVAARTKR